MNLEALKQVHAENKGERIAKKHFITLLTEVKWFYEHGIAITIKPAARGYTCTIERRSQNKNQKKAP